MKSILPANLIEAASEVLASSSVAELRQLRVDQRDDHVQLTGHVGSFYHKQLAQESIRHLMTGLKVINRVSVSR